MDNECDEVTIRPAVWESLQRENRGGSRDASRRVILTHPGTSSHPDNMQQTPHPEGGYVVLPRGVMRFIVLYIEGRDDFQDTNLSLVSPISYKLISLVAHSKGLIE